MKIIYDASGDLLAASLDSEPLGGGEVVTVANNSDALINIDKYVFDVGTGSLVLKKYLVATPSATTAAANGTDQIIITVQAMQSEGTPDTAAADFVTPTTFSVHSLPTTLAQVSLNNGTASFPVSAATAGLMNIMVYTDGYYKGSTQITFI